MPYRHAGDALCATCNDFTNGKTCRRCGRPLCGLHAPGRRGRCDDCEAEFAQITGMNFSEPLWLLGARVLMMSMCSMLLILTGQLKVVPLGGVLSIVGALMIVIFVSSLALIQRRRQTDRSRFLAERLFVSAEAEGSGAD